MRNKRIVFIGTVNFSAHCLKRLIALKANVVGVVTKAKSDFNADYAQLGPIARKAQIPVYEVEDVNAPEMIQRIRALCPDVIFCFGWSQLIKEELLKVSPMGVIGTHPTALPANRGRHPLIWALALGLSSSAMTFFKMDQGADTGDIVAQAPFAITYQDDAASLYRKIEKLSDVLLKQLLSDLERGRWRSKPQGARTGNSWRKRSMNDGAIDWRMSSRAIYNLVRALTKPYVGAHCLFKGSVVKVFKVSEKKCQLNNIEPGKVLSVKGRRILVKTYDGAVEIIDHEFKVLPASGEYL